MVYFKELKKFKNICHAPFPTISDAAINVILW